MRAWRVLAWLMIFAAIAAEAFAAGDAPALKRRKSQKVGAAGVPDVTPASE
jgi:hypothetical protein